MKEKKYFYDYKDYEDNGKNVKTLTEEILSDPELPTINKIVIGEWGYAYEESCEDIIQMFVEHATTFAHIESLFIGDMDYEECEVSWIQQSDYSKLWAALPNLKYLTIKGSDGLKLGEIIHQNLLSLEIICGGLPKNVIHSIAKANLPKLEKLNLYLGIDHYGFDGGIEDIETITNASFPSLKYLGLGNSDMQNEITKLMMTSPLLLQLEVLDLSNGTLADEGAKSILDNVDKLKHLKLLDLHYHYLTDEMMAKINRLPLIVNIDGQQEVHYYKDEAYTNPMLTE